MTAGSGAELADEYEARKEGMVGPITITSSQIGSQVSHQTRTPDSAIVKISSAGNGSAPVAGVSIYEVYGLEKGFSENISAKDQVSLSLMGQYLSQAEREATANRDVWVDDPGRLLEGEAEFDEAFKEVASADGGLIFRKFNTDYLDNLQNVPDALLVYDYMTRQDSQGIVVTSGTNMSAIVLKMETMVAEERYNARVNMTDNSSNLYDAHERFKELLVKDDPSLTGVDFELVLKGDQLAIAGGDVNGKPLTARQIETMEKLANGKAGSQLRAAIFDLRDESITYYNKYTESGRSQAISREDFDERFGDIGSYLKAFSSSSHNQKFNGPDDPHTYRMGYFSESIEIIRARLSR